MRSKMLLLPLYESPEEYFEDPEISASPPDSLCSTLSSVVVDDIDIHDSAPPSLQSTQQSDKKHVKFADTLANVYSPKQVDGRIHFNYHYSGYLPHREYGTMNHPSILRPPSHFPNQLTKEASMYNYTNRSTQTEPRKLRTRIRLRTGFSPAELTERQKATPLICLLVSFIVMVVLFIWFLSGGDSSHSHKHKKLEPFPPGDTDIGQ